MGDTGVREIPVMHESSRPRMDNHFRGMTPPAGSTPPRTTTPPRHHDQGRATSPMVREIPIQHINTSRSPDPHNNFGYTIYKGNSQNGSQAPPQQGYPQQGGYPQQQGGYPTQQGYYPTQQQGGYPQQAPPSGYPTQQGYQPQPPQPGFRVAEPQPQQAPPQQQQYHAPPPQQIHHAAPPSPRPGADMPQQQRTVPVMHESARQTEVPPPQPQSGHQYPQQPPSSQGQGDQPQSQYTAEPQISRSTEGASQNQNSAKEETKEKTPAPEEQKPNTPLGMIQKILADVQDLEDRVNKFRGLKTDREYKYLEEMLTRSILKLDGVESGNDDQVRQARRHAVKEIQGYLDQLELCASFKDEDENKESKSDSNSESETKSESAAKSGEQRSEPMDTNNANTTKVKEMTLDSEVKC